MFLCYGKLSSVLDYCNLSTAFRETKRPIRKAKGLRILYYEHLCASSALNSSAVWFDAIGGKELPCLILLSLFAALVSTTSVISMFPFRVTNSWSLPVFLARARARWHLTLSMPRASVDTSRAFQAMRASSWARWTNPTWIQSAAFRRRCQSTKRRRLKTLARRLAP